MTDLITRLREGEGADRELDRAIAIHFGPYAIGLPGFKGPPEFTDPDRGIAVCIVLAAQVLPGLPWWISSPDSGRPFIAAFLYRENFDQIGHSDICRAFLMALITAKEAEHDR